MLTTKKSSTISSSSTIKAGKTEEVVASMNATIQEDGAVSINQYIQDKALYLANKAEAEADRAAFMSEIEALMEG